MILPIYTYGQPILRGESKTIDKSYPEIHDLINSMFETMNKADGIGLAAPQIGLSIRLFIIDADGVAKNYPECVGFKRVMINPEITSRSDETVAIEEGCLSFPGIHEKVQRPVIIEVEYFNENFVKQNEHLEGFNARIVQHEYEHLHGRVFIDSIAPMRRQMNKGKLNNLIKGKVSCNYTVKTIR